MEHDDELTPPPLKRRSKRARVGIFVIPSLFTTAALFCGFYSIINTVQILLHQSDDFLTSALLIVIAGFLDGIDGRLARAMHAESDFGFEYDSIADVVSFGVAPSVMAYGAALSELNRLGWFGAFLFLACAAIRLARFNVVSLQLPSRKYFKGLPSPVAAGGLAVSCIVLSDFLTGRAFAWAILVMTMTIALLMVSNVRFRSFKDLDLRRQRLQVLLIIVWALVMVFSFREIAMFIFFLTYLAAGVVEEWILFRRRRRSDPRSPFLPFGDR